ncbi:zinc finger protein 862-like [Ptychodera flava]|uniref:zinc finger protein 862-like n=1 Tax=Ptychodera flava TaxID=63121 RepID=UPI00396A7C60
MKKATASSYNKAKDAILHAMYNVYWLSKEHIANGKLQSLNRLCREMHGIKELDVLGLDDRSTYSHSDSIRDFQQAISDVIETEMLDMPGLKLYSLMCDEGTDVVCLQYLIMYIQFMKAGRPENHFFSIRLLTEHATAENLCNIIKETLAQKNLPTRNLIALSTDSASVMIGTRSGVAKQLRDVQPFLINIHCIAHRLSLCSSQAADKTKYLVKYQEIVNSIFYYFHNSPKHLRTLSKIQSVLEESSLAFKPIFHTRWLSFGASLQALAQSFESLLVCLESDAEQTSNYKAQGLVKKVKTYEFLATTMFMCDAIALVNRLSLSFQKQNIDLSNVKPMLDATVAALQQLKTARGPLYLEFCKQINDDGNSRSTCKYKTCEIENCVAGKQMFDEAKREFIDNITKNISDRFPDKALLSAFSILDPQNLPTENSPEFHTYGNDSLAVLLDHFGKDRCDAAGENHEAFVSPSCVEIEWSMCKYELSNYENKTMQQTWEILLSRRQEEYPELCKLTQIALLIPVATVDCERGVSQFNLIKTAVRNRLSTENVERLMRIAIEGPDIEQFDFQNRAFTVWSNMKDTRIFGSGVLCKLNEHESSSNEIPFREELVEKLNSVVQGLERDDG